MLRDAMFGLVRGPGWNILVSLILDVYKVRRLLLRLRVGRRGRVKMAMSFLVFKIPDLYFCNLFFLTEFLCIE